MGSLLFITTVGIMIYVLSLDHWASSHGRSILGEAKALRTLLDRLQQVGAQFVVGLIGGQVQLVKASVGRWQPICRPVVSVDLELLGSVHPLQSAKALQRHFA